MEDERQDVEYYNSRKHLAGLVALYQSRAAVLS